MAFPLRNPIWGVETAQEFIGGLRNKGKAQSCRTAVPLTEKEQICGVEAFRSLTVEVSNFPLGGWTLVRASAGTALATVKAEPHLDKRYLVLIQLI